MANPQKENGFTSIANEIMEKIVSSGLNGTEIAVILFILRKTYGYQKTEDEISLSQFLLAIPVSKATLCNSLKNLQLVKIIKLVKKGNSVLCSNKWVFNKDYDTWQLVKKSKLVKKIVATSKDFCISTSKENYTYKRKNTQKKITKEIIHSNTSEQGSQVKQVMDIFYKINPTLNWGNKTYRSSAEELINKFGLEKTLQLSEYATAIQGEQFAPTITNPYQLKEKATALMGYYQRNIKSNQPNVVAI